MEEGDFTRQRRNVLVMAVIVIAYNLGGGDLTEVSFQGMKLKNHVAIIGMFWIAFCYVVWRYWLYSGLQLHKYSEELWTYIMRHAEAKRRILADVADHPRIIEMLEKLPGHTVTDCQLNSVTGPLTPNIKYVLRQGEGGPKLAGPTMGKGLALALVLRHTPFLARRTPAFSDVILPYLLAGLAVVVAVVRWAFF